jgi:hypothetical protein
VGPNPTQPQIRPMAYPVFSQSGTPLSSSPSPTGGPRLSSLTPSPISLHARAHYPHLLPHDLEPQRPPHSSPINPRTLLTRLYLFPHIEMPQGWPISPPKPIDAAVEFCQFCRGRGTRISSLASLSFPLSCIPAYVLSWSKPAAEQTHQRHPKVPSPGATPSVPLRRYRTPLTIPSSSTWPGALRTRLHFSLYTPRSSPSSTPSRRFAAGGWNHSPVSLSHLVSFRSLDLDPVA